jgi:hypothetical protein
MSPDTLSSLEAFASWRYADARALKYSTLDMAVQPSVWATISLSNEGMSFTPVVTHRPVGSETADFTHMTVRFRLAPHQRALHWRERVPIVPIRHVLPQSSPLIQAADRPFSA